MAEPIFENDPTHAREAAEEERFVVDVDGFEGPLDLLLELARRQKVDLQRISVLALAEQYILFIEEARNLRLELAADYLVMAAWLAYLKSRLLLPRTKADEAEDPSDLAAALAERLRRLEIIRAAGQALEARPRVGRDLMLRGMPDPTILNGDGDDGAAGLDGDDLRPALRLHPTAPESRRRLGSACAGAWSGRSPRRARRCSGWLARAADWTALDGYLIEYCVTPELRRTVRASSLLGDARDGKGGQALASPGRPFRPAVGQAPLSGRPGRGRLMAEIARLFPDVEQPREARQLAEGKRIAEALLFAATEPLAEDKIAARLPDGVAAADVLAALRQDYADRGVRLVRVGAKWLFRTADDLAWLLSASGREVRKLSRAALETLAIIAYHQPATRAEIEDIRGVAVAKGTLDVLLETGWVKPRGRRRSPGRPITFGTTDGFLLHFGLEAIGDLPGLDELRGAGLFDRQLPAGFTVPLPRDGDVQDDEDPLDAEEAEVEREEELYAEEDGDPPDTSEDDEDSLDRDPFA